MTESTIYVHCLICRHSTPHILRRNEELIAIELECSKCGRKFVDRKAAGAQ